MKSLYVKILIVHFSGLAPMDCDLTSCLLLNNILSCLPSKAVETVGVAEV